MSIASWKTKLFDVLGVLPGHPAIQVGLALEDVLRQEIPCRIDHGDEVIELGIGPHRGGTARRAHGEVDLDGDRVALPSYSHSSWACDISAESTTLAGFDVSRARPGCSFVTVTASDRTAVLGQAGPPSSSIIDGLAGSPSRSPRRWQPDKRQRECQKGENTANAA